MHNQTLLEINYFANTNLFLLRFSKSRAEYLYVGWKMVPPARDNCSYQISVPFLGELLIYVQITSPSLSIQVV